MYVKSFIKTHVIVYINNYSYELYVSMFVQILIICNVKVNVSPLKLTSSLLLSSR